MFEKIEILAKIKEFFLKSSKKEEISKIDLEVVDIEELPEPMDVEPSSTVLESYKRQKTPLSIRIKRLLVWLELMDAEDSIDYLITDWTKSLLIWIFNILMTGSLIFLAILPFYTFPLILIPFVIFSFGIAYYVIMETLKEAKSILRVGKRG